MSFLQKLLGADGVTQAEVGAIQKALRISGRPIEHATMGHYRVAFRVALVNTQAANSHIFEIRNTSASGFIIPTRLNLRWLQRGVHTAAIEDSLDAYMCTTFTAVDTTNTVTPVPSVRRTSNMAAAGSIIGSLRHVTVAGAAAGMTGGTLTKIANPFAMLPKWLLAAQPTAGSVEPSFMDMFDDVNGTHPFVFAQNEGFIIENRVLLGAAATSSVLIDFSWAEVTAY